MAVGLGSLERHGNEKMGIWGACVLAEDTVDGTQRFSGSQSVEQNVHLGGSSFFL